MGRKKKDTEQAKKPQEPNTQQVAPHQDTPPANEYTDADLSSASVDASPASIETAPISTLPLPENTITPTAGAASTELLASTHASPIISQATDFTPSDIEQPTLESAPSSPKRSPGNTSMASTEPVTDGFSPLSTPEKEPDNNITLSQIDNSKLIIVAQEALRRAIETKYKSLSSETLTSITQPFAILEDGSDDETPVDLIEDATEGELPLAILVELRKRYDAIQKELTKMLRTPSAYAKTLDQNKSFLFAYHSFYSQYYLRLSNDKTGADTKEGCKHFDEALEIASDSEQLDSLGEISRLSNALLPELKNSLANKTVYYNFINSKAERARIRMGFESTKRNQSSVEDRYTLGLLYLRSHDLETHLKSASESFHDVIVQVKKGLPDPMNCAARAHEQIALLLTDNLKEKSENDLRNAAYHFRMAAQQGIVSARHSLIAMRDRALHTKNNLTFGDIILQIAILDETDLPKESMAHLQQAADGSPSHPEACYELALRYAKIDLITESCRYWKKAAEAGHPRAKQELKKYMSHLSLKNLLAETVATFEDKHKSSKNGTYDKINLDLIRHQQYQDLVMILNNFDTTPVNTTLENLIILIGKIRGGQVTAKDGETLGLLPAWRRKAQGPGTLLNNGSQMGKMLNDGIQEILPWLMVDSNLHSLKWQPNNLNVAPSIISNASSAASNFAGFLWTKASTVVSTMASYVSTPAPAIASSANSIVPFLSKVENRDAVIAFYEEIVTAEMLNAEVAKPTSRLSA